MKFFYRCSLSLGFMLLMAGCAAPDLGPLAKLHGADELQAKASMGKLTLSPVAWPTEKWWERYGDLQLNTLMEEALKRSPSLKMAQARVRQAEAIAGRAEAARAPQTGFADRNNRQLFSGHGTTPPPVAGQWKWVNEATLNGAYEFDFWGKNQSAIEAAVGMTHAVEVDAYASRLVLVTNILRSYVRLQTAHQQLDIATATLKQRQRILELIQQRVRARIDSAVDLKQAESLVPTAKVQIAQINESIELSKAELGALSGQGPDRGMALMRPTMHEARGTLLPSALPAELIGRRPDIVAQRWRVEAASKEIINAKAQFYPNISLTALIGMQSLGFPNFNDAASRITGIGPALSLPIFDGGRLKSNLAGRNAEYDYAVEQYNATVIDAVRDVVSQLVSLRGIEEQRAMQQEAVTAADEAYGLALQRYRSGVGNYLQVLAAELQKLASERQQSDLDMRAIELDIGLARSLGGGFAPQN
ncbi:efflux transporter outer membrane subunit [Janthinobacterium sp. HLX7-2]|uniref:efflux transporter outer membrane subunit n=1 Tax=Janthinobacterium sp. HLX7-2 TaxID=1259331 RepID=UPI003F216489